MRQNWITAINIGERILHATSSKQIGFIAMASTNTNHPNASVRHSVTGALRTQRTFERVQVEGNSIPSSCHRGQVWQDPTFSLWVFLAGCFGRPRPFLAGCFGRPRPFLAGCFGRPRPFLAGCFGRHDLFLRVVLVVHDLFLRVVLVVTTFSRGLFWSSTTFSCRLFWVVTTFSCGLFWSPTTFSHYWALLKSECLTGCVLSLLLQHMQATCSGETRYCENSRPKQG